MKLKHLSTKNGWEFRSLDTGEVEVLAGGNNRQSAVAIVKTPWR